MPLGYTDAQQHEDKLKYDIEYADKWAAKHAAQRNFDDQRWQNTDDGSTEQPRQRIQYHEKAPFNLVTFLLAAVLVIVVVILTCPVTMAVVGWLFRL